MWKQSMRELLRGTIMPCQSFGCDSAAYYSTHIEKIDDVIQDLVQEVTQEWDVQKWEWCEVIEEACNDLKAQPFDPVDSDGDVQAQSETDCSFRCNYPQGSLYPRSRF